MQGSNQLTLCMSELLVAVQEYLDKRMTTYAPKAVHVNVDRNDSTFTINLKPKDESKLSDCYRMPGK